MSHITLLILIPDGLYLCVLIQGDLVLEQKAHSEKCT